LRLIFGLLVKKHMTRLRRIHFSYYYKKSFKKKCNILSIVESFLNRNLISDLKKQFINKIHCGIRYILSNFCQEYDNKKTKKSHLVGFRGHETMKIEIVWRLAL